MERNYSLSERLIAVALTAGVVLAVMVFAVIPTRDAFEQLDEEIALANDRLYQLYERRGNLEALADMRRALADEDAGASGRIVAANRNLARAAMQASARKLIQGQGGSVTTVRELVDAEGEDQRVIVRLQFDIRQTQLPTLLVEMANARPLLFIDHIDIRTENGNPGPDGKLVTQLDLSAYFSSEEAGG